jgi:O-antigen ligase
MKWAIITILLAATVPFAAWLRRNSWIASKAWMVLGFMPFAIQAFHLNMAAISWTEWPVKNVALSVIQWPGYVKGIEISVLDVLALALYLSLPASKQPLPFRFSMALYFSAALLSLLQAEEPMAAFFFIWQLARMFLVYAVVTRACADPRVPHAILQGMAVGLFMEAGITIWQRFALGVVQPSGTLIHQNLLGMMSHFVVFPFLGMMLAGSSFWLPAMVSLAGIVVGIITASRATIATDAIGFAIIFLLSGMRQWTSRKAAVLLLGAITLIGVTPVAFLSLQSRFDVTPITGQTYEEREAFKRAAAMMLSDHPWGVGVNHYILVANNAGYNRWAGVAPTPNSEIMNVHNVYWLVAAESGYFGLIAFLLFLIQPLIVAFRCGWAHRADPRGDLLIGLGVSFSMVYIHSLWEWIFVDFQVQYMFAISVGLVAGLARQLGYFKHPAAQSSIRRQRALRLRLTRVAQRRPSVTRFASAHASVRRTGRTPP